MHDLTALSLKLEWKCREFVVTSLAAGFAMADASCVGPDDHDRYRTASKRAR